MRILWTLFKVIVALAIAIPVGILAIALTVGVVGALVGLAIMALKLACVGLIGYGIYRVARAFLAPASKKAPPSRAPELPAPDPYYQAALRELDAELGTNGRG